MKFLKLFRRQPETILSPSVISSVFDNNHKSHIDGNTKLIENEHVELIQVDEDMEGGTCVFRGKKRGTIRSEVFNNSENLMILQRSLMEKMLSAIENMKLETQNYEMVVADKQKILKVHPEINKFIESHHQFLVDKIDLLKNIHDGMIRSLSSSQSNKTIKSTFASPTTSLFLPHSSTPYRTKNNLKDVTATESALYKSREFNVEFILSKGCSNLCSGSTVADYEANKSHAADNTEYSISDVSSWFQTKIPNNIAAKETNKNFADETFETKVANFRNLLMKVKEIIDGKYFLFKRNVPVFDAQILILDSYSDNSELARTTAHLETVVARIIDDEEKKRKLWATAQSDDSSIFCIYALIILKTRNNPK